MAKRRATYKLNAALLDRLEQKREREGRSLNVLVEQALAEFLNVPLANRDLPEQPVEMCANCERGVLNDGRCGECRWRRDPRASQDEARRSAAAVRARVQTGS